jgi:hypothetical protein
MARPTTRTVLTIVMDVLVLIALVLTAGIVATFFGAIKSTAVGGGLADILRAVTPGLGLPEWSTPHGGAFSGDSAVTVVALLGIEWVLSMLRRRHNARRL